MMKKRIVAMAITAGLCCAGRVTPAFAGHWEEVPNPYLNQWGEAPAPSNPDYLNYLTEHALRAQGYTSLSYNDSYRGLISYSMNWQEDDPYLSGSGFLAAGVTLITPKPGSSGIVNANGKIRVRFQWVRNKINGVDDPNDNPPAVLNLSLHSAAISFFESELGTGDVSNVQLASKIGVENGASYSGTLESPTLQYPAYSSEVNKHFVISVSTSTIDSQGRLWSPWFTFDGSAMGNVTSYSSNSKAAQTSFSFGWEYDNRAVTISSSAETTYHKGTNGEQVANTDNTQDVAATWNETLNMWYWNGSFDANLIGSPWDYPTYTWSSTLFDVPPGDVASINTDQYILDSYSEEAGPGAPVSLALSAEDTDGRYLIGTYTINFHNTHENDYEYKTQDEAPGVFIDGAPVIESITANPPYALHNGDVELHWTNVPYAEILDSNEVKIAGDTVAILATGFAPAEVIAGAAGITLSALSQTNNQQDVNYNDCWYDNDPVSGNPTATWGFSLTRPDDTHLSEYKMIPHITAGHKLHFIQYDGYDAHGYAGEQKLAVETLRSEAFYGEFIPLNP